MFRVYAIANLVHHVIAHKISKIYYRLQGIPMIAIRNYDNIDISVMKFILHFAATEYTVKSGRVF